MIFIWSRMLFLLVLIPALVVLYILLLKKKRKITLRYSSLNMVKKALEKGPGFRRHLPPLLMLLALALMLVALGRPAAVVTLPSQQGTVILTMDISGSMRAEDVEPSRLAAAQQAALAFVNNQPENVRIGVVAFASTAMVVQEPTLDREAVRSAIDRFRLQRGTAVGNGILTTLDVIFEDAEIPINLSPSGRGTRLGEIENVETPDVVPVEPGTFRSAVIVLLTDGQTTHGPDPVQAAELAANLGIRIYTVGLGTPEGAVIGFGNRSFRVILDEESLEMIAYKTKGEYFHATTNVDLTKIYHNLSAELIFETEETELTAFFTAVAAVLALFAALLSLVWFGRIV